MSSPARFVVPGLVAFLVLGAGAALYLLGGDADPKPADKAKRDAARKDKSPAAEDPDETPREERNARPSTRKAPPEPALDLRLPSKLPSLAAPAGVPTPPATGVPPPPTVPAAPPYVEPTRDDPKLELEGDVSLEDANLAMRTVFPGMSACYQELKTRAPQAGGRLLLKFSLRSGEGDNEGKAGIGDYFIRETQFTDPTFLDCLRNSVNGAWVDLGARKVNGSVTMPVWLAAGGPTP